MAKPRKVEEPAVPPVTTNPLEQKNADPLHTTVRYATPEEAHAAMGKVMRVHHDVLRRLAEYDRS
jgi:hypothetical protein